MCWRQEKCPPIHSELKQCFEKSAKGLEGFSNDLETLKLCLIYVNTA